MKDAFQWEQALRIHSLTPILVYSLCFMFAVEDVISQFSAPAIMSVAMFPPHDRVITLEPYMKFFYKLLLLTMVQHSNRKVTNTKEAGT